MSSGSVAHGPPVGSRLCGFDEIPADGGLERVFGAEPDPLRLVLLRAAEGVACFVNVCPHFSLPLNHEPGRFLVFDDAVVCAHHTAFFRLSDGICTDGPCRGVGLERVAVHRIGNDVLMGPGELASPEAL